MDEKKNSEYRTLAGLVDALQAEGRYTFVRAEAMAALKVNSLMLKKTVMRLAAKKRIVVPKRGFYVIVPLEYRTAGSPPPSWFITDLMRHLGRPYYVGVLSAASLHGAAHQQPQEFQVVTDVALRPIVAGRSRIRFLGKHHHDRTLMAEIKTETGTMRVSTPEATAIDLLRYVTAAGGLGNVATVLAELAEQIDPGRLAEAVKLDGELAYAQRLGYLIGVIGEGERADELAKLVAEKKPRITPLRPGRSQKGYPMDRRWRVAVNEEIEVDL